MRESMYLTYAIQNSIYTAWDRQVQLRLYQSLGVSASTAPSMVFAFRSTSATQIHALLNMHADVRADGHAHQHVLRLYCMQLTQITRASGPTGHLRPHQVPIKPSVANISRLYMLGALCLYCVARLSRTSFA
jgi:hypothetical protein